MRLPQAIRQQESQRLCSSYVCVYVGQIARVLAVRVKVNMEDIDGVYLGNGRKMDSLFHGGY